jgi:hypothetical protein
MPQGWIKFSCCSVSVHGTWTKIGLGGLHNFIKFTTIWIIRREWLEWAVFLIWTRTSLEYTAHGRILAAKFRIIPVNFFQK